MIPAGIVNKVNLSEWGLLHCKLLVMFELLNLQYIQNNHEEDFARHLTMVENSNTCSRQTGRGDDLYIGFGEEILMLYRSLERSQ